MRTFRISNVCGATKCLDLRRPFQFGKVIANRAHYTETSVVASYLGRHVAGRGGGLHMDPWSLRGRFEPQCYTMMPQLIMLCEYTANRALQNDHTPRTPVDYWKWLSKLCYDAAKVRWGEDFPKLAVSVAFSPYEFAIWDAYGKAHDLPWAKCLGQEFLGQDCDLSSAVAKQPAKEVEVLHTVGGKDAIFELEEWGYESLKDGIPETVYGEALAGKPKWLKPKVTGDFDKDVARVKLIDEMLAKLQQKQYIGKVGYFFDANGACPDVQWLRRFLNTIEKPEHGAEREITNFEQPFATDKTFAQGYEVHSLSNLCDFSIDESLVGPSDVERAKEMGYNRLGLKVCKSVTSTLEVVVEAAKHGLNCDMQDLTQVGRGLLVSVSMAAWCFPTLRIESNGYKNVVGAYSLFQGKKTGSPDTEQIKHFDIHVMSDGCVKTANLTGSGFSL